LDGSFQAQALFGGTLLPRFDAEMLEAPKLADAPEESRPTYELGTSVSIIKTPRTLSSRLAMRVGKSDGEIDEMIGASRPAIVQRRRHLVHHNERTKMWRRRKEGTDHYRQMESLDLIIQGS
jgi:hypothetical protein